MTTTRITISARVQLLWMDFSAARAYFKRHVLPVLQQTVGEKFSCQLLSVEIERENPHNRVAYYDVEITPFFSQPTTDITTTPSYTMPQIVTLTSDEPVCSITNEEKIKILTDAVENTKDGTFSSPKKPNYTCFDFWESIEWWKERVCAYWFEHPFRSNARRVAHLLNQLARVLRQNYRLKTEEMLLVLNALGDKQIDLIDSVFVEPMNGSLLPSHLSTIFMHNKQQTGLNMKHEANKQFVLSTKYLQSEREFDPKIYLKKCTSCVKRDIFELMIRVSLSDHNGGCSASSTSTDKSAERSTFIFCLCASCDCLRKISNAWRYYDCDDEVWVRFEFSRKIYQTVCEIVERETQQKKMQLVYSSDKNEFSVKDLFVNNFVNYYAFYENGQHPLIISQCFGNMRNTVTILYIFAVINWVMIEDARRLNRNNSISLNQQSLCKSMNNPLYSIFSENCISRLRAETVRRYTPENAAYINRGLGIVPNTGVNAFNVSHRIVH